MRRRTYVIFSIALVLACCFIAGCSILSPSNSAPEERVNGGVSFDNTFDEARNYSFEEVISDIYLSPIEGLDRDSPPIIEEMHFLSVSGEGLDGTGNASSWTVVLQYKNQTEFITYDRFGKEVTDWSLGYSGKEVFPAEVISPGTLFNQNRERIFKTPQAISTESRNIELSGGTYTLTILGGNNPRILVFDAKTGALTSSNDR